MRQKLIILGVEESSESSSRRIVPVTYPIQDIRPFPIQDVICLL
ncbi:hypothetical protein J3R74_001747 [Puniceicoccus vermicola]